VCLREASRKQIQETTLGIGVPYLFIAVYNCESIFFSTYFKVSNDNNSYYVLVSTVDIFSAVNTLFTNIPLRFIQVGHDHAICLPNIELYGEIFRIGFFIYLFHMK